MTYIETTRRSCRLFGHSMEWMIFVLLGGTAWSFGGGGTCVVVSADLTGLETSSTRRCREELLEC